MRRINANVEIKHMELEMARINNVRPDSHDNFDARYSTRDIPGNLIPEFQESSPETFFELFYDLAQIRGWDRKLWSRAIPVKFIGRVQILYRAIPKEDRDNYQLIKQVILMGYAVIHRYIELSFETCPRFLQSPMLI